MSDTGVDRTQRRDGAATAATRRVLLGRDAHTTTKLLSSSLVVTVVVAVLVRVVRVVYTPTAPMRGDSITWTAASYADLIDAFVATYSGTQTHLLFVAGPALLFLVATGCGYLRGGLLPTTALVSGPVFGLFVNKFGTPTPVATPNEPGVGFGPTPLSDAVVLGVTAVFLYGVPIAVLGYLVGAASRRLLRSIRGRIG